jgi:predicted RNA binding protein YcfA (HicA-like mRNA interferase family)
MPAREVVRRLKRIGFRRISQRGSHLKLRREHDGKVFTTVVPMHTRNIAITVLGRILQQAGLDWKEFDQ